MMSSIKKCMAYILVMVLILGIIPVRSFHAYAGDTNGVELPEPIKVVDFSYSFDELVQQDEAFSVVNNGPKPCLIYDNEMGQVLKLSKAIISGQELDESGRITADSSEYSTIKLSNPFVGLDYLTEYKPYETVETKLYGNVEQPEWKEGITISYWIKSPEGVNSNVLGFTSERYQMQADDYAKYLCTVKYDIDSQKYTDEEKQILGITLQQVDSSSDFYFELASEELYNGEPIYKAPDSGCMGRIYWMNPNFKGEKGYYMTSDGDIKKTTDSNRYDMWCTAPVFNNKTKEHSSNSSRIRYAWTYGEMWLDASSSFYFNNDNSTGTQLNPNHIASYNTTAGMQHHDSFNINSWNGGYGSYAEAAEKGTVAKSPVSIPDKWHNVTVIIQNDWVRYYLDGEEIDIEKNYSSYGLDSIGQSSGMRNPWKRFNKGTGSRYGYGCENDYTVSSYHGNYVAATIMEWLTMDCTEMTIGGGNRDGDSFNMYANTDEIEIKNIVFYDTMLSDEQIQYLYNDPFIYDKNGGKTPTVKPTATPTVEPTATPTVEPSHLPTSDPKDFKYEILRDSTISITEYAGNDENVVIPESIDGYIVTGISSNAFNWSSCRSITLSKTISDIETSAFEGADDLEEIIVSAENGDYESIDGVLFDEDKTVLVCYPSARTDSEYSIPDGVEVIGDYAFNDCDNLENIVIPNSVLTVCSGAFSNCDNLLGDILASSKVTTIEKYAFRRCNGMTEIYLPKTITEIDAIAFAECSELENIIFVGNSEFYSVVDGVLFNKDKTELIYYCSGKADTTYAIPDSVTRLGNFAFDDADKLVEITIPESVTEIGAAVFRSEMLTDIHYQGTEEQWNDINVDVSNIAFESATIHFKDGTSTKPDDISYILGDVDLDGNINATDALLVLKYAAKLSDLTEEQMLAADTLKDGTINASDALMILKYAAKLIDSF